MKPVLVSIQTEPEGAALLAPFFFHRDPRPHALIGAEDGSARTERHPAARGQLDHRRASGSLPHTGRGALRQIALDHDAGDFGGHGPSHITSWSDHRQRHDPTRRSRLDEIRANRLQQQAIDGGTGEQFERCRVGPRPAHRNPVGGLRRGSAQ